MKIESTSIQQAYKMMEDKYRQRQQEFAYDMRKWELADLQMDLERLILIRQKEVMREFIELYNKQANIDTHYLDKKWIYH